MVPSPRGYVVLATLLFLAMGCNNGKAPTSDAALAECRQARDLLRAQNDRLEEQIADAQSKANALQSEIDSLAIKNNELAQWSRQVAERFGPSVWFVGPDEKPLPYQSIPNATPQLLLRRLNGLFKQTHQPRATLKKIEGDTAFIRIEEQRHLTQEMGTTGATAYLQAITYTLTSLPSIQYVAFDFEAGDHAMPGRYSR
jgi:hypothetical protein